MSFFRHSQGRIALKFALFVGFVVALATIAGAPFGLGVGFVIATGAWAYGNSRLAAMFDWLRRKPHTAVPSGHGIWDEAFALLYRENRLHAHELNQITQALLSFRKAAQAMPDGVLTLNEHRQIAWCNDTAAEMFGLDPNRDRGQVVTNLIRNPELASYLDSGDRAQPLSLRLNRREARFLQIQLIDYGEGQHLLLARDITQLERLETMRRDFVANVSHELQTPLTVLAGFLETLRDHPDMPETQQHHFIDLMDEQSTRMRRIVGDLLTLTSLESGSQTPLDTPVDMDSLLARTEQSARALSRGRHTITMTAAKGVRLVGSESELSSAFDNLVSNAIRYTPDDGVMQIRFELVAPAPGAAPQARFSVIDTGIGIEAHHIPRLTERFYRVDRSRSRDSGGTGLGLAIAKHVLTRHDGTLEITSTLGSGTTMTAVFPASRVLTTEPAATAA
ncbi:phosphate regulon sensor histidine kinase PhoR [soil metagenome]